ncbi:MAG: 2Fe-2S iron-sulfur cluster-binding protein [Bacteroidetes bacterium]|nr:2Fe-2S iron-sulfur cluster-binding protein [Bacteroidota bacterium]
MVQIRIQNLGNRSIESKDRACKVIELIHENGIDWMHACGKKGRCTTCKMSMVDGQENLSSETAQELHFRDLKMLLPNERLACQAHLLQGVLTIRVPDSTKFPHLTYTK